MSMQEEAAGNQAPAPTTQPDVEAAILAELSVAERRDVVEDANQDIMDITGIEATVPELVALSSDRDATALDRLLGKRAVRFLGEVGDADSQLAPHLVDEDTRYDVAEAIVVFGAATGRYVEMVDDQGLSTAEATAVYALRETILEEFGASESFAAIFACLEAAGISMEDVRQDVVAVVQQLDEIGLIVQQGGKREGAATRNRLVQGEQLEHIIAARMRND